VYLTPNLDSLTRAFVRRGFSVARGEFDPLGVSRNYVNLPSGQTIALETTYSWDTSDWRVRAIRDYGTHVSGLIFRTDSLEGLRAAISVDATPIEQFSIYSPPGDTSPRDGFALAGPQPLDVVVLSSHEVKDSLIDIKDSILDVKDSLGDSQPPNGLRRVMWLLLTVSDTTESQLRQFFDDLGVHRSHAGCCDYWILGPLELPVAIRFELPSTTFRGQGEWLSIEDGGVVFD
jgi:hypothetical protein